MILQQFNWLANQIMSIYKHIFVYIETLAVSKLIRQNKKKLHFVSNSSLKAEYSCLQQPSNKQQHKKHRKRNELSRISAE